MGFKGVLKPPFAGRRGTRTGPESGFTCSVDTNLLPSGQMAKCENCDSVHWQRQQSSVQSRFASPKLD